MTEKIVIIGNPNVGKSILFNQMDSIYSVVANYPHTTVDITKSPIDVAGTEYELWDCPGIESLAGCSEDEYLTRDVLIKENPAIIVQCVDARNIERSLLLTAQLIELDIPMVISLNILDETHKKGMWVDSRLLESQLGIPVVETIATEDKGTETIFRRIEHLLENGAGSVCGIQYRSVVKNALERLEKCFSETIPPKGVLLMLLQEDKNIEEHITKQYGETTLQKIRVVLDDVRRSSSKRMSSILLTDQADWVEHVVEKVVRSSDISSTDISERIGRLTRHPIWGWPILGGVVYIIYLLVGKVAGEHMVGWLEDYVFQPSYAFISSVIPNEALTEFLVGKYGILSTGLGNALATALPILFMFFLMLNIMEDTGYFSNLCILVSRATKKFGLSGQSILPLMLGFGCKTMATLTTKMLDSKKERYIAIFLIAFAIPCAPQMGLIMGMLGGLDFSAFFIIFGVLMLAEFIAGVTLNKIIKQDVATDFILEIPVIRFPSIRNLFVKLYHRMLWFLKEVPPLFMLGALILFCLDKSGGLEIIRQGLTPIVVNFLALPIETVDAFLLCLVKHEAGAVMLISLSQKGLLNYAQIVVSLIIITSLGPCIANLMAIIRQLNVTKGLVMRVIILIASILTGGIVSWVFRLV